AGLRIRSCTTKASPGFGHDWRPENDRMNPRAIRLLLVLSAFVAGLLLCFSVVLLVTDRGGAPIVAAPAIGGPFRLTDQNGKTITDGDLKGHPFLVFFGYTHCPDVCPTALADISDIFDKLGPDAD